MKKIINGRKYDTETAECIGLRSYGNPGDFTHFCESLYRKKTGEFFLYGHGGPASRYSRSTSDNSWSGGEAIIPMTEDEARKWAEDFMDYDEYESAFGEVDE